MNILGPYNQDDWDTMLLLKRDVKRLREKNPIEYQETIEKELDCINSIIVKSYA
jgi:hypothetical protein